MATVSVHVDASVKDVIAALERVVARRAERALAVGGADFETRRTHRTTATGSESVMEHTGSVAGNLAFVRVAVAYDSAHDTASIQVSETIPTAAASVTGTVARGSRGGARVDLKASGPRGMVPAYRQYVAGIVSAAKREAERGGAAEKAL